MESEVKLKEKVVFLRGKKVILRPRHLDDVQRITRWINDPEIRLNIISQTPLMEHEERAWIEKTGPNDIVFSIHTHEGRHIGVMGIHHINWIDRTATTGAIIGEKDCRGKGYGTDAKTALLEYAFETLGLRKICSDAIAYNKASIRFNEKCGYRLEGVRKKQIFRKGKYWDQVLTAVFAEDWLAMKEKKVTKKK